MLWLAIATAILPAAAVELPTFPDTSFEVKDFGATGNGNTNDTAAINRAIEKCSAAGGGSVMFPAGNYLAASIHLRSNVRLLLDRDCVIVGAAAGYDPPEPNPYDRFQDFGHSHFHNALMWGESIENFAVIGGRLNGGHLVEDERKDPRGGDKLIAIKSGRRLLFQNVTHDQGAHFVYLLNDCENVTLDHVVIKQSRDGINLVSSRNVDIHDCIVTGCGDDAVALKSDYALGRKILSANIAVSDCRLESAGSAMQIGSETVGDFRDIVFSRVRVGRAEKAAIGISCSDGGIVDGIHYSDIAVKNAACPLFLRVNDRLRNGEHEKTIGAIRNVTITNLAADESRPSRDAPVSPSIICGKQNSFIDHVILQNVRIASAGGGSQTGDLTIPQPKGHAHKAFAFAPAAGLFVNYVRNLTMQGVEFSYDRPDGRPSIVALDVENLMIEKLKAPKTGTQTLRLENITNFSVRGSPPLHDQSANHADSLGVSD